MPKFNDDADLAVEACGVARMIFDMHAKRFLQRFTHSGQRSTYEEIGRREGVTPQAVRHSVLKTIDKVCDDPLVGRENRRRLVALNSGEFSGLSAPVRRGPRPMVYIERGYPHTFAANSKIMEHKKVRNRNDTPFPEYMSPEDVAEYTGLSTKFWATLRCKGGGPVYAKPSAKAVRYRRADVDAWMADRLRRSTFDDRAVNTTDGQETGIPGQ